MGPGIAALDCNQALDAALCQGWNDGQKAKFDDQWCLRRLTPRKPRSKWSKANRDKVAALIEQGRMHPPGALTADPAAAEFFETLDTGPAEPLRDPVPDPGRQEG
ncbi:hypothetical protein [Streptomyces sp. S3(2020)]|uniref:YdeI/OmpD-associated family protein n=1 Tax=Streptomyces sp. S3(2020) TaxID=2732044 RepID=UPI001F10EEB0|nr:hypothetical protein [Streptomyces sp. S3(2020)]